jgi:hypothetical protein
VSWSTGSTGKPQTPLTDYSFGLSNRCVPCTTAIRQPLRSKEPISSLKFTSALAAILNMDVPLRSQDGSVRLLTRHSRPSIRDRPSIETSIVQSGADYDGVEVFQARTPPSTTPHFTTSDPLNPVPLPQPYSSQVNDLPTPFTETLPDLGGLVSIGAASLPSITTPPARPILRTAARDLRLPSFETLGIVAPHPDCTPSQEPFPLLVDPPSSASVLTGFVGDPSPNWSPGDTDPLSRHPDLRQFVLTTTPPADTGEEQGRMEPSHGEGNAQADGILGETEQDKAGGDGLGRVPDINAPNDDLWTPEVVPIIRKSWFCLASAPELNLRLSFQSTLLAPTLREPLHRTSLYSPMRFLCPQTADIASRWSFIISKSILHQKKRRGSITGMRFRVASISPHSLAPLRPPQHHMERVKTTSATKSLGQPSLFPTTSSLRCPLSAGPQRHRNHRFRHCAHHDQPWPHAPSTSP